MTIATAAVFGLGSMGFGVGANILKAGHRVFGVDLRDEAVAKFQSMGGEKGPVSAAAHQLDMVVTVVINAAQTEAVLFGEAGIVPLLREGAVVLSCATVAPEFARAMAERCAAHGVLYLDAPISGGPGRAADGTLSVLASGSAEAFAAAKPALDAMAETVFEMGDAPGAGSAMKAVNQMLVGVQIAAAAEAMTFGISQGISPETFMEIIPKCAGTSWALENRGPHIVKGDYTPLSAVNIWPKDLGIVLDIAHGAKFGAPLTAAALQQFLAAAGQGMGFEDDAAIAKVYARNAGLTLPGDEA
ncbi:MAG: L-threonate dehydrogenase [Mangrovicoccus sp.]